MTAGYESGGGRGITRQWDTDTPQTNRQLVILVLFSSPEGIQLDQSDVEEAGPETRYQVEEKKAALSNILERNNIPCAKV